MSRKKFFSLFAVMLFALMAFVLPKTLTFANTSNDASSIIEDVSLMRWGNKSL